MIHQNAAHSNGHITTVEPASYPPCESDYEPAPAYDAPMPGWRNQHPKYVHHVEWVDGDGRKHGLTLRTDDRAEMIETLRQVKCALAPTPTNPEPEPEQATDDKPEADELPASKPCPVHPYDLMYLRTSKHGHKFYSHRLDDESWCNGKAKA